MIISSQQRFNQILQARNDEYELQRLALFADIEAVASLPQRFNDPDPVTAFIAKELHIWSIENPPEFQEVENFIQIIEPALRKNNKTAGGGGGSQAIFGYLSRQYDKNPYTARRITDYLLLQALMRPETSSLIYGSLFQYYANFPVAEPEVWIRVAIEENKPDVFDNIAQYSLRMPEKQRVLRALNYERARAKKLKKSFPSQLEELRNELTHSNN
jgi:hypothetical protein